MAIVEGELCDKGLAIEALKEPREAVGYVISLVKRNRVCQVGDALCDGKRGEGESVSKTTTPVPNYQLLVATRTVTAEQVSFEQSFKHLQQQLNLIFCHSRLPPKMSARANEHASERATEAGHTRTHVHCARTHAHA